MPQDWTSPISTATCSPFTVGGKTCGRFTSDSQPTIAFQFAPHGARSCTGKASIPCPMKLQRPASSIPTISPCFSRVRPSNLPALWTALLRSLPPGLTEICCHPGHARGALARFAKDVLRRESDLNFLTSPEARRVIASEGIQLVGYRLLRDAMRSAVRFH